MQRDSAVRRHQPLDYRLYQSVNSLGRSVAYYVWAGSHPPPHDPDKVHKVTTSGRNPTPVPDNVAYVGASRVTDRIPSLCNWWVDSCDCPNLLSVPLYLILKPKEDYQYKNISTNKSNLYTKLCCRSNICSEGLKMHVLKEIKTKI